MTPLNYHTLINLVPTTLKSAKRS